MIPTLAYSEPNIQLWHGDARDSKGRFVKGHSASPATEFKKGQHWRPKKAHWDKEWLYHQYIELGKATSEIADMQDCTANNISFWLNKHGIHTRTISEARALKYWGASGEDNPMYGVRGAAHPGWKGGLTPDRQAFYNSLEWADVVQLVWHRDNATCQRCGVRKDSQEPAMHIHHIVSFAVKELRLAPDNLILFCVECHHWVHSSQNEGQEFLGKGGDYNGGEEIQRTQY